MTRALIRKRVRHRHAQRGHVEMGTHRTKGHHRPGTPRMPANGSSGKRQEDPPRALGGSMALGHLDFRM